MIHKVTQQEILNKTTWNEYMETYSFFVNLFNKKNAFTFIQYFKLKPSISGKITKCVNDVVAFDKSENRK